MTFLNDTLYPWTLEIGEVILKQKEKTTRPSVQPSIWKVQKNERKKGKKDAPKCSYCPVKRSSGEKKKLRDIIMKVPHGKSPQ